MVQQALSPAIHLGVLFAALAELSKGVLGWYNYSQSPRMLIVSSRKLLDRISAAGKRRRRKSRAAITKKMVGSG